MNSNGKELGQVGWQTMNILPQLAVSRRVWWTKSQSSLLNIYLVSVDSGPRSYLYTSPTVRIPEYLFTF